MGPPTEPASCVLAAGWAAGLAPLEEGWYHGLMVGFQWDFIGFGLNACDYAADANIYDQEWVKVTLTTQHGRFDLAIYMFHVWLSVDLVGTLIWSGSFLAFLAAEIIYCRLHVHHCMFQQYLRFFMINFSAFTRRIVEREQVK